MEGMNRTTRQGATLLEKVGILIAGILFILALLAGIVAGVFVATATVSATELRWWATILTVIYLPTIIITWRIAKREAKEHLKGFTRGLDGARQTLVSVGRGLSATASIARSGRVVAPPMRMDDLLPRVGSMRLIESRRNNDDVIDL